MGVIVGGALNSIISFPESMLLYAELLLAEVRTPARIAVDGYIT